MSGPARREPSSRLGLRLLPLLLAVALHPGPALATPGAGPADTTETARLLLRWAREQVRIGTVESRQAAAGDLARALELRPDDPELWIERGRLHEAGGFETEARLCFEKATQVAPANPDGYAYLGLSWKRAWLRRLDPDALARAIRNFREVTELRPHDSRTWVRLVPLYYEQGDLPAARRAAERALERRPMFAEGLMAFAYLAYHRGEMELADSVFAKAVPLLPPALRAHFETLGPLAGQPFRTKVAAAGTDSMRRFWDRLDPDPTSRANELRLEYWSRVAHVLLLFEDPLHPDLDARAETYLRYGAPQQIRLNPGGTRLFTRYGSGRNFHEYPVVAEAWEYPDLGMRVLLHDRMLSGRYDYPHTGEFDPASRPNPAILAKRGDLLAFQNGLAVFPTLPPPGQRIDLQGVLVRFEGTRGPRLVAQVRAPGAPGDTLWARWVVLDSSGREVARNAGELGLSLCDPARQRLGEFSAELSPGVYAVAVSVRDPHLRRGLFHSRVTVPAPPGGLAMSDMILSCGTAPVVTSGGAIRTEANTSARVPHGAPLVVYFEIYRLALDREGMASFEYEYSLREVREMGDGELKVSSQLALSSTAATRVDTQVGSLRRQFVTVPLQSLPAGRYRFEIRLRDLRAGTQVGRTMDFFRE